VKLHRTALFALVTGATLLAVSGCGKSAAPTAANTPLDQAPPAAPTNVHGTYVSSIWQDHLQWDASSSSNTASYEIWYYASAPGANDVGTLVNTVGSSVTDVALAPVPSDCVEYYRVRARDASGGEGAFSQTATVSRHNADQGAVGGGGTGGGSTRRIDD